MYQNVYSLSNEKVEIHLAVVLINWVDCLHCTNVVQCFNTLVCLHSEITILIVLILNYLRSFKDDNLIIFLTQAHARTTRHLP